MKSLKFAPTTMLVEDSGADDTDTGSICSVDSTGANAAEEHAASQAEVLLVKRPGSSKKKLAKLTKVAKPPARTEESAADTGSPHIQDTLKECLTLMEDIRKNQQNQQQHHPGAFTTTLATGPAQGSCYYCYVQDHYSSFCPLKIKHSAERLSSQKRATKSAAKKGGI
jgi:hypothetical protein